MCVALAWGTSIDRIGAVSGQGLSSLTSDPSRILGLAAASLSAGLVGRQTCASHTGTWPQNNHVTLLFPLRSI